MEAETEEDEMSTISDAAAHRDDAWHHRTGGARKPARRIAAAVGGLNRRVAGLVASVTGGGISSAFPPPGLVPARVPALVPARDPAQRARQ